GDAALDLYSTENYSIVSGERQLVSTGIAMEFPAGYFASIRDRSGLAAKKGITVLGGVIEFTYRGEYGVVLLNTGKETFEIKVGDRIAQVVIQPVSTAEIIETTELSETARGSGNFGSTGN
ncbi:MAG: dUTP diphosphatase, partial [Nanoarchaeota archaeon]|nr:dUTP diphosphatase [Nanoarchaeota archaeon]